MIAVQAELFHAVASARPVYPTIVEKIAFRRSRDPVVVANSSYGKTFPRLATEAVERVYHSMANVAKRSHFVTTP